MFQVFSQVFVNWFYLNLCQVLSFSPNPMIPQQRRAGLCQGSTRLDMVYSVSVTMHGITSVVSHTWCQYVVPSFCGRLLPPAAQRLHMPLQRNGGISEAGITLITADSRLLCSGFKVHHGVLSAWCVILFCHHSTSQKHKEVLQRSPSVSLQHVHVLHSEQLRGSACNNHTNSSTSQPLVSTTSHQQCFCWGVNVRPCTRPVLLVDQDRPLSSGRALQQLGRSRL